MSPACEPRSGQGQHRTNGRIIKTPYSEAARAWGRWQEGSEAGTVLGCLRFWHFVVISVCGTLLKERTEELLFHATVCWSTLITMRRLQKNSKNTEKCLSLQKNGIEAIIHLSIWCLGILDFHVKGNVLVYLKT